MYCMLIGLLLTGNVEKFSTASLMEESRPVAVSVPGLRFPAGTSQSIFSEATAEN